jgi:hypothetical protein
LSDRKAKGGDRKSEDETGNRVVARYLADMTGQLESMARASKLELLAYLLAMARAEAESQTREARDDPTANPL